MVIRGYTIDGAARWWTGKAWASKKERAKSYSSKEKLPRSLPAPFHPRAKIYFDEPPDQYVPRRPIILPDGRDAGGWIGANVLGDNPPPLPPSVVNQYRRFHGVDPQTVVDVFGWAPGNLTCIGKGINISYGVVDAQSEKDGAFIHPHLPGVKVYRRARGRDRVDLSFSSFPRATWAPGEFLGLSYTDHDGEQIDVDLSEVFLCWVSKIRALCAIGAEGVLLVCRGGELTVDTWLRG